MKIGRHKQPITVDIIDTISLGEREAAFLRVMAKHCIETNMQGYAACERLIGVLDAANVIQYDEGPVYGVFEERPEETRWRKS